MAKEGPRMFKEKVKAEVFARKKNKLVRKGKWIVVKGSHGGWIAWHQTPGRYLLA